MIAATASRLHAAFERWLTTGEHRAAERLGLFRILYALFYLWHLSWIYAADLGRLPEASWHPVGLLCLLPVTAPSALPAVVEPLLVGLLVLLIVGLSVRAVTGAVLVAGLLLETFHQSYGKVEHATVFLTFYLPLFMVASTWGETWSLDAVLRRRAGRAIGRADQHDWRHAWPIRATLLVLVALFASATAAKCIFGSWLTAPHPVADLLLGKNVEAVLQGVPTDPFAPLVATTPALAELCRWGLLLFEGASVVVMIDGHLRDAYLALALVFHALNGLLLVVTFTPILIVYALFVDWPGWLDRMAPLPSRVGRAVETLPSRVLVAGSLGLALLLSLSWNGTSLVRATLQVGGLLDWRTIWYPVLPLAAFWCVRESVALARDVARQWKHAQ